MKGGVVNWMNRGVVNWMKGGMVMDEGRGG